jgi:hypothetical protein
MNFINRPATFLNQILFFIIGGSGINLSREKSYFRNNVETIFLKALRLEFLITRKTLYLYLFSTILVSRLRFWKKKMYELSLLFQKIGQNYHREIGLSTDIHKMHFI